MKNVKNVMEAIKEYRHLNDTCGNLSCFDFPSEYDRMDTLQIEIDSLIEQFTANSDISERGLKSALENLVSDMESGDVSESVGVTVLDQVGFIEMLASTMSRKEGERFSDMINWMQPADRAGYLETRFILVFENDPNEKRRFYYDDRMSFIVVTE